MNILNELFISHSEMALYGIENPTAVLMPTLPESLSLSGEEQLQRLIDRAGMEDDVHKREQYCY